MKCEIRFCSLFFGEDDFSGGMSGLTFVLMIEVLPFMVVTFGFVVMSLYRMVVTVVRLTRFVRLMVVSFGVCFPVQPVTSATEINAINILFIACFDCKWDLYNYSGEAVQNCTTSRRARVQHSVVTALKR